MSATTHRIEATLKEDGTLTLDQLPFHAGQVVEVLIVPRAGGTQTANRYPLRGTLIQYDRPFESVAEED